MELFKLAIQIVISTGAAFLAAWLAGKRFRSEKWWGKKADAYMELVEALHKMKWSPGEHHDAYIEHLDLDEDYSERLWEDFKEARRNVWRIAETSSFLISDEVLVAVREMESGLSSARSAQTWFEHLDEQWAAVDTCMKRVKELGARELQVKSV